MRLPSSLVVRETSRNVFATVLIVCTSMAIMLDARAVMAGAATRPPFPRSTKGAPPPVCPRDGDAVWLLSTRHLDASDCRCGVESLQVERWCQGTWQRATWLDFSNSPGVLTSVYVHGNRIESHEAPQLGLDLYARLTQNGSALPPMRFVVWSWPSDRIAGPIRDARDKGERAMIESIWLAQVLRAFHGDTPTSLLGFSYGGRVILGATHMLAGGRLRQQTLAPNDQPYIHPHVVLAAAAVDTNSLCSGGQLGQALQPISQLTLVSNSHDSVLRYFRVATGWRGSEALGTTGLSPRLLPQGELRQANFAGQLGRTHSWERHRESPTVLQFMRSGMSW